MHVPEGRLDMLPTCTGRGPGNMVLQGVLKGEVLGRGSRGGRAGRNARAQ